MLDRAETLERAFQSTFEPEPVDKDEVCPVGECKSKNHIIQQVISTLPEVLFITLQGDPYRDITYESILDLSGLAEGSRD